MESSTRLVVSFILCALAILIVPCSLRAGEAAAVSKDGVPISYSVYGENEPVLVFVHGWSCDRTFWRLQIPYFEKYYRLVTLDLAGHGTSGRQRDVYSMEAFGEDVAAVVRALGARKVILIGHSMGGAVIIEAAQIVPGPVIALVGIDTMQDFEEEYTVDEAKEIIKPFKEDFRKATDEFARSIFPEEADPDLVGEIAGMMSHASRKVGMSALEEMLKVSYVKAPPKINVPVWCLNSDVWPTKPEVNRRFVPEFNLRVMPGVGHFLMLESPDEFNRQLHSIIREIVKEK